MALASGEHELWLSPISVRQALLLVERGRVRVDTMPTEFVERMMRMLPRREAALTHDSAIASRQLALTYDDPADRFLAATAQVPGLTLVTADARLIARTEYLVMANG